MYLTIAAAFGVSAALESTYVARNFAQVFIRIGEARTRSTLNPLKPPKPAFPTPADGQDSHV